MKMMLIGPALLALAACGGGKSDLDQLDNKLTGKDATDPALTAALEDQIMVDPSLSSQANDKAIKPPAEPMQTPVPEAEGSTPAKAGAAVQTLGGLAAEQAEIARESFNGCGLNVQYSMDYAAKLPDDFPLYPQSRVAEAAGSDQNGCKLRALTLTAAAPLKAVAQHYAKAAAQAGYRVAAKSDPDGVMVSGKRAADGGAFYIILNAEGAGTSADLVINNGK
jgi:hypothetical protein